jgi:LuxR family maltose regulon positive regulatory protein
VQIILANGIETIAAGEAENVSAWLDRLPTRIVQSDAGLAILGGAALWVASGFEAAATVDDWLDVAEITSASLPAGEASTAHTTVLTSRALFGSANAATRLRLARRSLDVEQVEGSIWTSTAQFALGLAAFFDDQPVIAQQALSECVRPPSPSDTTGTQLFTCAATSLLALLEYQNGEDGRADLLLTMAELHDQPGALAPGSLDLALAFRARHCGDPSLALKLALRASRSSLIRSMQTLAFLEAAIMCAETGQRDEMNACIEAADSRLADQPNPDRLLVRRRRAAEERQHAAEHVDDQAASLTEREHEVLRLLATDLSRREIANELFLAHNTVKTYVQRLYQKLDVSSRPAAVARARQRGWLV